MTRSITANCFGQGLLPERMQRLERLRSRPSAGHGGEDARPMTSEPHVVCLPGRLLPDLQTTRDDDEIVRGNTSCH